CGLCGPCWPGCTPAPCGPPSIVPVPSLIGCRPSVINRPEFFKREVHMLGNSYKNLPPPLKDGMDPWVFMKCRLRPPAKENQVLKNFLAHRRAKDLLVRPAPSVQLTTSLHYRFRDLTHYAACACCALAWALIRAAAPGASRTCCSRSIISRRCARISSTNS